jgi:hypothetical protein
MFPVIFAGHWVLNLGNAERLADLGILLAVGAVSLAAFLLVVRLIGLKLVAERA